MSEGESMKMLAYLQGQGVAGNHQICWSEEAQGPSEEETT